MQEVALLDDELLEELLLEDELLLDDELLEELLDEDDALDPLLSLLPPPQAAITAAAPPPASQPSICRRWRSSSILCRSRCNPGSSWPGSSCWL
jgi:hypothetical protein